MEASTISRHLGGVRRPRHSLRFTRDEELVRLLRSGDERAFEEMFDRHHRGILSFCRHMVTSREEAEDAVQHTFAAAYRDLIGSDKPIQLKAWLYTIARNRCLSILRARREQVSIDDVEPSTDGLSAEVQRREDLRVMLADLARLPEDQRAALVLSELEALSHDEIGVTLGVRKDKVKALVFQARESLASSRSARETDCREIQEQLSVLRGGALRRSQIKRHVEICPACAAFKAEVKRQRAAMVCLLPVAPSALLRDSVMAAIFGGGSAGGGGALLGGGGGLLAAAGGKGLAAKVLTVAVVAGGATGGGLMAVDELSTAPADTGRESLAAAPEETESVELVTTLRERAQRAAVQRARDHAGARGATHSRSGGAPSGGGTETTSAGRRGDDATARRGRPRRDGAATGAPAAEPPVPESTPADSRPSKPGRDTNNGVGPKPKTPKKPKKPKKPKGPRPAIILPSEQRAEAAPGRRQRKQKPKHQAPAPPAHAHGASPTGAAEGRGQEHGSGQGHGNQGDGGQGPDKPKKDDLLTDLVPVEPPVVVDEPVLPAALSEVLPAVSLPLPLLP